MSTPPPDGTQPPSYDPPPAYDPPQAAPAPPSAYSAYGAAPPPASQYSVPPPTVPGKTLGIVAFVVSFFANFVGLILGIVALVQSKKAGHKNGFAVAAIIIGSVSIVLGIILLFALVVPLLTFSADALQACQAVDFSGTVEVNGIPVQCSTLR